MSSAAPRSALLIAAMVAVRLLRLPVRTWRIQWTPAYAGSLNTLCAIAHTLYQLWQQCRDRSCCVASRALGGAEH